MLQKWFLLNFDVQTSSGSASTATSTAVRLGLDVHQPCIPRASISVWLVGWEGLLCGRIRDSLEAWAAHKKEDAELFRQPVNVASPVGGHASLERLVRDAMVSRCCD